MDFAKNDRIWCWITRPWIMRCHWDKAFKVRYVHFLEITKKLWCCVQNGRHVPKNKPWCQVATKDRPSIPNGRSRTCHHLSFNFQRVRHTSNWNLFELKKQGAKCQKRGIYVFDCFCWKKDHFISIHFHLFADHYKGCFNLRGTFEFRNHWGFCQDIADSWRTPPSKDPYSMLHHHLLWVRMLALWLKPACWLVEPSWLSPHRNTVAPERLRSKSEVLKSSQYRPVKAP